MVVSSLYTAFYFQSVFTFLDTDVPICGNACHVYSGLSLFYFPAFMIWLCSIGTGVKVGVDYTDYYTYLRRMGLAGRFGIGVYIYVC